MLDNATRWSSGFLMLESVKRAYDKGVIGTGDNQIKCPVAYDIINCYMQVLAPCYILSVTWQSNLSPIADVLPGLLRLFNAFDEMQLPNNAKKLAELIVKEAKFKFKYELDSDVYLVNY